MIDIIGGDNLITETEYIIRIESEDGTIHDTLTSPRSNENDPSGMPYPVIISGIQNIRLDDTASHVIVDTDEYSGIILLNV